MPTSWSTVVVGVPVPLGASANRGCPPGGWVTTTGWPLPAGTWSGWNVGPGNARAAAASVACSSGNAAGSGSIESSVSPAAAFGASSSEYQPS